MCASASAATACSRAEASAAVSACAASALARFWARSISIATRRASAARGSSASSFSCLQAESAAGGVPQ